MEKLTIGKAIDAGLAGKTIRATKTFPGPLDRDAPETVTWILYFDQEDGVWLIRRLPNGLWRQSTEFVVAFLTMKELARWTFEEVSDGYRNDTGRRERVPR